MRIYKYPLVITDKQKILMPERADILHCDMQGLDLCVWVLVNTDTPEVARTFRVIGTGHPIPDIGELEYRGTVQQLNFVWHVFESIKGE